MTNSRVPTVAEATEALRQAEQRAREQERAEDVAKMQQLRQDVRAAQDKFGELRNAPSVVRFVLVAVLSPALDYLSVWRRAAPPCLPEISSHEPLA